MIRSILAVSKLFAVVAISSLKMPDCRFLPYRALWLGISLLVLIFIPAKYSVAASSGSNPSSNLSTQDVLPYQEARAFGLRLADADRDLIYQAIYRAGGRRLYKRTDADIYDIKSIYPDVENCRVIFDEDERVVEILYNFNPGVTTKESLLKLIEERYGPYDESSQGLNGEYSYLWKLKGSGIRFFYTPTSTSQVQTFIVR
ncbi:hypothetical protein ACKC9G_07180 [Pokkaliibacter sp. CJK22405]|uniref:hypothetical protein n=1 Tax=Pokkaliibacter sp. CJK22405 TaxID=3384615 RepID=UPI00398487D6